MASPIRDSSSCHASLFKISTLLLRWHVSVARPSPASLCLEGGFLCITMSVLCCAMHLSAIWLVLCPWQVRSVTQTMSEYQKHTPP